MTVSKTKAKLVDVARQLFAKMVKDYDFVIDGTDNFPAKFLINDACIS